MTPSIVAAMTDPKLFGRWFAGATWAAWRAFLAALFALPMTEAQAALYRTHTGRTALSTAILIREAWLVVGRRGGKSIIAALILVYLACFRVYRRLLAPGERGVVMLLAADRRQARVIMRYVLGLLDGVPMLAGLVAHRTAESVELTNGITIEIHTSNFRAVRGYTVVAAIADEIAFWRSEESANPDTEILNALRPAMATVPTALLLCISSAYARRGALWDAYRGHYGKDSDPVLVWQADTATMNPTVDATVIAAAYAADEASARAEYGAQFRSDLEDYVSPDVVERAVVQGRHEVPPERGRHRYHAFVDPAGGSGGDSMTLAIAHHEGGKAALDLIREARPPFSPEDVVTQFAADLSRFGLRRVTGDRYGGDWPAEGFKRRGVAYEPSEKTKSELYATFLPLLNSATVEVLDDRRLTAQLLGLERRTAWGGRDSIDHRPGGHDDAINAAAGALVLAAAAHPRPLVYIPDGVARIGERRPQVGSVAGQAPMANRGVAAGQAAWVRRMYRR
jgi:hypothetical protein